MHLKYHLACWKVIFEPMGEGGLWIRSIRQAKVSVLGKRLWRIAMSKRPLEIHSCSKAQAR